MKKNTYRNFFSASMAAVVAVSGVAAIAPTEAKAEAITSFSDVPVDHMFYEEITSLAEREIIKGYPDGKFRPGDHVKRGQAAVIIAGALGLDTQNVNNPGFKDVSTTDYYYGAVAAMVSNKMIDGIDDELFKPYESVTRAEMAAMISRAFQLIATPGFKTPFTDIEGNPYASHITALYENGVTKGVLPTQFGVQSNVTRGQLAVFVVRAESILTDETGEEIPSEKPVTEETPSDKPTPEPIPEPKPEPTPPPINEPNEFDASFLYKTWNTTYSGISAAITFNQDFTLTADAGFIKMTGSYSLDGTQLTVNLMGRSVVGEVTVNSENEFTVTSASGETLHFTR